jgi:hypothetical protein
MAGLHSPSPFVAVNDVRGYQGDTFQTERHASARSPPRVRYTGLPSALRLRGLLAAIPGVLHHSIGLEADRSVRRQARIATSDLIAPYADPSPDPRGPSS